MTNDSARISLASSTIGDTRGARSTGRSYARQAEAAVVAAAGL